MTNKEYGYSIAPSELDGVNKICIIAWGLIGDVFIRVPIVEAVKEKFPDAEITVITESITLPIFEYNPAVDHIFVFNRNKTPLSKYLFISARNILALRQQKFDMCIDLYMGGSSPLVTRLSKSRIRLGFDHKKKLRDAYNLLVRKPDFCQQWILDLARVLEPLGISGNSVRVGTTFIYTEADSQRVDHYFSPGKNYFCVNLGSRDSLKCWPVKNHVDLAGRINRSLGYVPLVLTNPGQERLARDFTNLYKGEVLNPPVLPLGQVGALMDRCLFTITGDTSLMHMSFGIHKPTLVLFTHTRPEWHIVEDCRIEYCFHEDPRSKDLPCNKPWGDRNISVDHAFGKAQQLIADIDVRANGQQAPC